MRRATLAFAATVEDGGGALRDTLVDANRLRRMDRFGRSGVLAGARALAAAGVPPAAAGAAPDPRFGVVVGTACGCRDAITQHERLLAAAARVVREDPDFRLVLCGALDENREKLRGRIEALDLGANVRLLPYLDDADTTALLEGAEFLVYPSLFEGFGLPVLEAMALGTPVACSDLPALLEVARGAALFFDPEDVPGIAATMSRLGKEEETRDALVRKGRERAERYAGIDVAGAYHELLGSMRE